MSTASIGALTRFAFCVALVLTTCAGRSLAGGDHETTRHPTITRTAEPRTFGNAVLFEWHNGLLVRSSRFVSNGSLSGDFDGDDDIDLFDYNAAQICTSFSGPGTEAPPACDVFDFDGGGDVDLEDLDAFVQAFTGALGGVMVEAGTLVPILSSYAYGYYSGVPGESGSNALNGIARQAGYSQDDLWYRWSLRSAPAGSGQVLISNASLSATAMARGTRVSRRFVQPTPTATTGITAPTIDAWRDTVRMRRWIAATECADRLTVCA